MANPSAIQIISPAIERTKQFLFKPFRLGRFLKLTLVASLVEASGGGLNFNSGFPPGGKGGPFNTPFHFPSIHWPGDQWPKLMLISVVIGVMLAVVIPIGILIGYLLIRLRFSYFDCCLYMQDKIGPGWARYHRQAMRYLGLSLLIALGFWVVLIPIGIAIYRNFRPVFNAMFSGGELTLMDLLPLILTVLGLVFLLSLVGYLIETTMTSFVLPRMALEDASISDALSDVWGDVQAEIGAFALFVLFRALLSILAGILAAIALIVPLIVVALVAVLIGLLLKAISTTLLFVLGIPALILVIILFIAAIIGVSGTIGTFKRNYAIMFYAGRYPELAMILWPPQPPPPSQWNAPGEIAPEATSL
jgi:hypothetical protein